MLGGLQGTGLCLFRKMEHRPSQASLNAALCGALLPQHYASFVFRRERTRVPPVKSLQFSCNHIFQLLTKSQYSSPFSPSKAQILQKEKKPQLARFQAPSLSICKLGLIWVSRHNAEVPITHRGTFLRSNRLAITHLKLLELRNTERPCDGKRVT